HKDERIRHLAFHDPLTDLPNRALLMERLGQVIAANSRDGGNVALLFVDLDGFKAINDTFGHEMGDAVLKIIAQKLLAEKRASDTVARLGGDEFIILLDGPIEEIEVARIAQRMIDVINEPVSFRGKLVHVGASIGIAMHPSDGHAPVQLMKRADNAMYSAKRAGKNTYQFSGPTVESVAVPL
ncbi:MAG: GGDEF domain-containing protein, partial [Moraxellaceae bacterium]